MKILVTGADGFIGRALRKHLAYKGYDVIAVDIESGDLTKAGVADDMVGRFKPDVVVHLAAQVGILFNDDNVVRSIESNAIMTALVAKACAKHGAKLIHTSTSEVYGEHGDAMIGEDEPLIAKPTGIYAISKRWSEDAAKEYAPDGLAIVRPSMPYGPGCPPGRGRRAMDNMLWQAYHRKPIIVHRGAARSWCWLGDLCRGYELIIENNATGAYNIGRDDDERTMLWMAEKSCEMTGADKSLIMVVEPPVRKTMVKRLSTEKIRALGWLPTVNIEEGMWAVLEWVKRYEWTEQ